MKDKKISFLTVTLFAGIFLTFAAYIGIGAAMNSDSVEDGRINSFNRTFFGDENLLGFVDYVDYKLFGHIEGGNIIIGKDDWLFEAVDSEGGYERLLDYLGGCPFDESELELIATRISARQAAYEAEGINYMLVVIPDSITVCSDKLPWYLGARSENARLAQLSAYFSSREIDCLVDPTGKMKEESLGIAMYNNTENTVNAYGSYCIYNTVVSKYLADTGREVDRIHREEVDFHTRHTDGMTIAKLAGLERTIKNRTVSLTDTAPNNYQVTYNMKGFVATKRTDVEQADPASCLVVECADDWDRTQLMPYFSGTFDSVYYRSVLMDQPNTAKQYGATLVVQIIRESELMELLK